MMKISIKSTVWEDYHIDDDEYDNVVNGLRTGDISIHELYNHAYDTEINYESIEMMKDSNGDPIVEDENGMNPIIGSTTLSQPDPTFNKPAYIAGQEPWKPGMTVSKKDEDEDLLI